MTQFVYRNTERGVYTVGHYAPGDRGWVPESDHETADKAAERVHWLNGGIQISDIRRAVKSAAGLQCT